MINKIVSSRKMNCTLILPCICLLVLISMQCSRREDRAQRDASTVTVLYNGEEPLLGHNDSYPPLLVFLGLVYDHGAAGLERRLAERWEHSEDYRSWTFYLRRNVRWHDGIPVTAHDVKFSLELYGHPAVQSAQSFLWIYMESISVLDEFTVRITFTQPHDALDEDFLVYPKHLLEDLDPKEFWSWDFWTHPIGNGPYRYVRHVPNIMLELEANPDYYKGKPKIERVVFKLGGGNPVTELLSGNVDIVPQLNPDDIPTVAADGRFRVYQKAFPYYLGAIYWNHRHPLFRDRRVRRALTLAINRRELLQLMNFSADTPIFDTILSWHQFWLGEIPEPLPYDPERAKQLLEEAGWRDLDGDGIRERDGEEARFTAMASPEEPVQSAIYVQAQFLRVGIKMEIRSLAHAALRARLDAAEFEAAFSYLMTYPPYIFDYGKLFSSDSLIGYSNPQIVKLVKTAWGIIDDPEAVDQIYRELQPIFYEDLPLTFLYPIVISGVAHRRIRVPESFDMPEIVDMENLWIEEEKK